MNSRVAKRFNDVICSARGWDYRPALKELEALQWASHEEVRQYRLHKLRRLVVQCYENVPFYKRQFDQLGLTPSDVREEKDIGSLPIVTKKMLRTDYEKFWACNGAGKYDVWLSSGSTGEPFPFRLAKTSIAANTFAALARGRRWWNLDYGVPEVMIWSGVRDFSETCSGRLAVLRCRLASRLRNIRLVDVCATDRDSVRLAHEMMRRFKPVVIRSISLGVFRFCVGLEELGLDGRKLGIRAVIYTGETLLPSQRELVERVIGCKTICEYGCTELGIIAFECPRGGLHLSHENLVIEYLKDGRAAVPGEEAELVLTDLNNHVAPLVRYAIGDFVVPTEAKCECGRSLPLISSIEGRTHQTILTPKGSAVHGLFFTHLFDRLPHIHQFRVVQERLDVIRIDLGSTQHISDSDKHFLQSSIADMMGEGVAVAVEQVAEFPLSPNGKTQWIVSKVRPREDRPVEGSTS